MIPSPVVQLSWPCGAVELVCLDELDLGLVGRFDKPETRPGWALGWQGSSRPLMQHYGRPEPLVLPSRGVRDHGPSRHARRCSPVSWRFRRPRGRATPVVRRAHTAFRPTHRDASRASALWSAVRGYFLADASPAAAAAPSMWFLATPEEASTTAGLRGDRAMEAGLGRQPPRLPVPHAGLRGERAMEAVPVPRGPPRMAFPAALPPRPAAASPRRTSWCRGSACWPPG